MSLSVSGDVALRTLVRRLLTFSQVELRQELIIVMLSGVVFVQIKLPTKCFVAA